MSQDDYTAEDARVEALGTYAEQIRYLAGKITDMYGRMPRAYPAVGSLLSAFPFRTVWLAIESANDLTDENVFGKLRYSCNAYASTQSARKSVEEQQISVEKNRNLAEAIHYIKLKERAQREPNEVLEDLLLDGKITAEQYHEAAGSKEKAYMLVEEVLSRERI
jgi:hypothetical protein